MLGRTYEREVCSMARALEVVGERWSLLIVRDALFAGTTRFGDFQRTLGIAPNVLATRLEGFVAAGVLERSPVPGGPDEYVLTAKGRDLAGAVVALTAWGDRWAAPEGPPIVYSHSGCGADVTSTLRCSEHGDVDAGDVAARPGPGMPAGFVEERRARR